VEIGGLLSFLAIDGERKFIYAADEENNKIRSFSIDSDGCLKVCSEIDCSPSPVYVTVSKSGQFLVAA
jgi:6-phosphogluconolactonase (cycloisomerase 2 family)